MLPIAPPTDCNASTNEVDKPVISAVDNCTLPKVKLETVLEPEKNAPTAPKYEAKIVQYSPVAAAKLLPMILPLSRRYRLTLSSP
ncbi:Uncharacterised protein [Actinobacillus equuli]|nr:Uncharacterised protein [Actinobacillus equuli]